MSGVNALCFVVGIAAGVLATMTGIVILGFFSWREKERKAEAEESKSESPMIYPSADYRSDDWRRPTTGISG